MMLFVSLDSFADKRAAIPNFSLVNQQSLDKILKAEVFVRIDKQLRAAHLILDYVPISKSFQALKCVIKARVPRLQRISIAAPGFLISSPVPEGTLTTEPIPEGIPKVALPFQRAAEKPHLHLQPRERKRSLKYQTLKKLRTILKSSTGSYPLRFHWVTLAILLQPNSANTEELLPFRMTWASNANRGLPCKNY